VEGYGWLTGRSVEDVGEEILAALAGAGRLLSSGEIAHRYPSCWRCATPLVHRVVDEWFISCDEVRQPMREAAATVAWRPAHYGRRMDDWLTNMGDWCISRKRYWGLPLPFWFCPDGHLTLVGSKQELIERTVAGDGDLPELHRPWIDEVRVACSTCGADATRVPEVGDCWLDAGIVAFSTLGWNNPVALEGGYGDGAGEGLTRADLPDHRHWEEWFPAEVVCEMHEQVRLWFYSLLFMSVVLDGRAPYRSALVYGRVNDEQGREMHKSWGNAVWFDDAVEELGADTMRWLYASQSPARDLSFGYGPGREVARRFLTFWNSYAFFVTYANLDGFVPDAELLQHGPQGDGLAPIDIWMLARTRQLVADCRSALDSLDMPTATAAFENFSDDLSNWYVRSTRDRFWGSADEADKRAAYRTLWYALVTSLRCVAPLMPFVTDAMWANLVTGVLPDAPSSVHLAGYPGAMLGDADRAVLEAMAEARSVAELGRAARSGADLRRRQPLARLYAVNPDEEARRQLGGLAALVARECNVKEVVVTDSAADLCTVEVVPDFRTLGPKLRDDLGRVAAALRAGDYRRDGDRYVVGEVTLDAGEVQVRTRARPGFAVAEGGGWVVALDTELDPALLLEGRARDLIRAVQQLRKDLDLEVSDRIALTYPAGDHDVVAAHGDWIRRETLAEAMTAGAELAVVRRPADVGLDASGRMRA
jgi:isoleucyl-tRNA synthetase